MTDSKSVKLAFDCVGGDFERAGEASSKIKKMLQRLGIPADIVRRIAIGTYEADECYHSRRRRQCSGRGFPGCYGYYGNRPRPRNP